MGKRATSASIEEIEQKLKEIKDTEERINNQKKKNKDSANGVIVNFDKNEKIDSFIEKMLSKTIPIILKDINSNYEFIIDDEDPEIISDLATVAIRESMIAIVTGCAIGVLEESD